MPFGKKNKQNIKMICRYRQACLFMFGLCLILSICLADNARVFAQGNKQELANHLKRAEHYHDLGNNNQAKTELVAALKLDPKSVEILNSLGAIYLNLSETSADKESQASNLAIARKYFTSALDINNEFAAAWNGMAGVYYLSGDNGQAISCYKKALTLTPKRAYEVYTNLANTLRDCGQIAEAEENYKKAIELHPLYAPAHNGYAELLYDRQRYAEALSEAVEAIKLKPDYATAYYHLGLIQSASGNSTDALKAYLLSLRYETNPRYAKDTHSLISRLGLDVNTVSPHDLEQFQITLCRTAPLVVKENNLQTKESSKGISTDVTPKPSLQAPVNIHSLAINKDWQHAVHDLAVLLKKHPDDPVVLNELGLVYLNQKKYSSAERLFKRAWLISREQSSAIGYNLGQAYLRKHDITEAQEYLEKAKLLAKNDMDNRALINNALGIVLKQKGDFSAAKIAYENAITDGGKQYPVFHYNLALLLEKMEKPDEAAKELTLYLQLEPHGFNAKNAHERLSLLQH